VLTDRFEDIIEDDSIRIVAEFIGGEYPAKNYIEQCLRKGKTVVTANKEVIAKHGLYLTKLAKEHGCGLLFEASSVGAVPVIRIIRESLQANKISKIMGIINGTTNYILTKMAEEDLSFETALQQAQDLGYAEPDPTADVEGYDALYKLSILSSLAFQTQVRVEDIYREGITKISKEDIQYAKELGYAVKLAAIAKKTEDGIEARVHPTFIPEKHPLASVRDSFNAVFINGDAIGEMMFYGQGAGDMPTGSAIVSDILHACQNPCGGNFLDVVKSNSIRVTDNWKTAFFIRMTVMDKPAVLHAISGCFARHNVSLWTVVQKGSGDGHSKKTVPLIFITHEAEEREMRAALEDIANVKEVTEINCCIRVEK
jgi:homoserine dehydrogenase